MSMRHNVLVGASGATLSIVIATFTQSVRDLNMLHGQTVPVKTKLLGTLREFILTNVQRNMVALKPCIERACGRKWCNAR